jgi:hypothetical protein
VTLCGRRKFHTVRPAWNQRYSSLRRSMNSGPSTTVAPRSSVRWFLRKNSGNTTVVACVRVTERPTLSAYQVSFSFGRTLAPPSRVKKRVPPLSLSK